MHWNHKGFYVQNETSVLLVNLNTYNTFIIIIINNTTTNETTNIHINGQIKGALL